MSDPSFLAHLDDAQRDAILDDSERLLVIAGAGSGKTRVFVNRIARLVTDGAPASSVLALSYTNAAANEVASRLSTMGVTGVQAMTMHAWCHREPMRLFSSVIGRTGYSILDAEGSEDVLRDDGTDGDKPGEDADDKSKDGDKPKQEQDDDAGIATVADDGDKGPDKLALTGADDGLMLVGAGGGLLMAAGSAAIALSRRAKGLLPFS